MISWWSTDSDKTVNGIDDTTNTCTQNTIDKTNLNNGVSAIKKRNGELYGFLEDATWVVADDEVNNEISCTLTAQVTLALHNNKSHSSADDFYVNTTAAFYQLPVIKPGQNHGH